MATIKTHWRAFAEEDLVLDIPDAWKVCNYHVSETPVLPDEQIRQRIEEALNRHIITERLNEKSTVCILLDDIARPIEWETVLEVLCALLLRRGIPEKNITLLVGLAGHE